jgi:hypothetical protein
MKGQIHNFPRQFFLLCYYLTAGRIVRELWWTNQFHLSISFHHGSLRYHLEYEQYARWWSQFRDVVSPHPYNHHRIYVCIVYTIFFMTINKERV